MSKNQWIWALGCGLGALGVGVFLASLFQSDTSNEQPSEPSEPKEEDDYFTPPIAGGESLLQELVAQEEETWMGEAIPQREVPMSVVREETIEATAPSVAGPPEPPEKETPIEVARPQPEGDQFPLRLGSKGPKVERLKVYLMRNYGGAGIIHDHFDEETLHRVQRYLKVDEVTQSLFNRRKMGKHIHKQKPLR